MPNANQFAEDVSHIIHGASLSMDSAASWNTYGGSGMGIDHYDESLQFPGNFADKNVNIYETSSRYSIGHAHQDTSNFKGDFVTPSAHWSNHNAASGFDQSPKVGSAYRQAPPQLHDDLYAQTAARSTRPTAFSAMSAMKRNSNPHCPRQKEIFNDVSPSTLQKGFEPHTQQTLISSDLVEPTAPKRKRTSPTLEDEVDTEGIIASQSVKRAKTDHPPPMSTEVEPAAFSATFEDPVLGAYYDFDDASGSATPTLEPLTPPDVHINKDLDVQAQAPRDDNCGKDVSGAGAQALYSSGTSAVDHEKGVDEPFTSQYDLPDWEDFAEWDPSSVDFQDLLDPLWERDSVESKEGRAER
ncbi:hypothetical protein P7C71_g3049, partial [Lecanoromycetidae sp. Uapishka_2]